VVVVVVAAVEVMVAVTVPLVELELNATVDGESAQLGTSTAPEGDVVSAQVSEAVPTYPPVAVTVTVEVADVPGATAAGLVADKVKVPVPADEDVAATVTVAVPVAAA
jgi:hypothetical protein